MKAIIDWIFYTGGFMSHGHCYLWQPSLVALHVGSDISIGVAYAVISLTLLYLVRRAKDQIPFHWMILAFGAFIIACGCTHLMEVWTIWTPVYWLSGGIKALTAAASVTTAIALPRLVPQALTLVQNAGLAEERRSELEQANTALRREIADREKVEASVRRLNEELEERVQARTAQLAEANAQLLEKAAIVNHSNDAIFSRTLERKVTSWNPSAERLFGYSAAEMLGRDSSILVPAERREELAAIASRIAMGEMIDSFDTVRLRRDGTSVDVHLTISPLFDSSGEVLGSSVIARDMTERKRAEQQLRETQKLESLGIIAGGVAHDFNNLLVGIMGNSSLVLDSMPAADENRPLVEQVVLASEKAAHLTRQMLAYAGKGRFLIEAVNISGMVREIGNLVRASISKSVELRLNLDDAVPSVEADPAQLQAVIMNLMINGAEAIGENKTGTVIVTTAVQDVDEAYLDLNYAGEPPIVAGRYVSLEVHDNGCGMDEATRAKIFDPFFTTKFTGRGLGLAATLGTVRGHKGTIRVYSAPGQGATFKVLLPAVEQEKTLPAGNLRRQAGAIGSGTVLVVDDEEIVRSTAKSALERFGYTVLTAADGLQGVNLFRERAPEIKAVLLDMTMPVMGGEEALRHIREIRRDASVIVSSGYNEVEAIRRFTKEGIAAFIQKPYTASKLGNLLKRVIDGDPPLP